MSGQRNLGEHHTQGQQLFSWCGCMFMLSQKISTTLIVLCILNRINETHGTAELNVKQEFGAYLVGTLRHYV